MSTETRLIPAEAGTIALTPKGQLVLRSVGEAAGFAQLMTNNGFLPKGVTPQFAVVAIVAGAPLGLNPFESVQSIAVINGRPSLYGDGMKAVVQGSGQLESETVEWFRGKDGNRVAVRVTVKRKGNPTPIIGEFSETMARKAGLWGKQGPWSQYPDRMLLARARAFAYRDGFADILKGVRSAEEENDIILANEPAQTAPVQSLPAKRRGRRASVGAVFDGGTPDAGPEILAIPAPSPEEVAAGKAEAELLDPESAVA